MAAFRLEIIVNITRNHFGPTFRQISLGASLLPLVSGTRLSAARLAHEKVYTSMKYTAASVVRNALYNGPCPVADRVCKDAFDEQAWVHASCRDCFVFAPDVSVTGWNCFRGHHCDYDKAHGDVQNSVKQRTRDTIRSNKIIFAARLV